MIKEFSIPYSRIPVLIGRRGRTKKRIEDESGVKIKVSGNTVIVDGDAEKVFLVESVIKAIGRGFSPEHALNLLDPDYVMYVLDLPKERNHRVRIRARLIGSKGGIRKKIEEETGTFISIYGKTVSVIGRLDEADITRHALEMIIRGAKFSNVFRYIKSSKERWLL